MPYISIKSYPKSEETKRLAVEKINEVLLEVWGCSQEAISISIEEIEPADWQSQIVEPEIKQNLDKMMILNGQKTPKMAR